MKIESLIRRQAGTHVTLDDNTYHFKPSEGDPRHTATVSKKAHIQRFLSIPEGFQPAELSDQEDEESQGAPTGQPSVGGMVGVVTPDPARKSMEMLSHNELLVLAHDAEVDNAEDLNKADLILAIQRATGDAPMPSQEGEGSGAAPLGDLGHISLPNDGPGDDARGDESGGGDDYSDGSGAEPLGELKEITEKPDPLETMNRDQLIEQYREKMGRAPNGRMSDDSIRRVLRDEE